MMKDKKSNLSYYYYNYLSPKVVRESKGKLIPNVKSDIYLGKNAQIILKDSLYVNFNYNKKTKRDTIVHMEDGAQMIVEGKFYFYYGCDIFCKPNSVLELGSGFFNINTKIRCGNSIKIGKGVAISHDVTIMDSDFHFLEYEGYRQSEPVVIGNHVWIGSRAMILKGVKIGDGAVIGAGSIVTRSIPPNCIAAGNPARVIRENITWRGKKGN